MTQSVIEREVANAEPRNLLSLEELSPRQFGDLLDLADAFKEERRIRRFDRQIPLTSLALLFEKPSTRTRVSFEVAMYELGGHALVLNSKEMQLSRGETPEDTARILSGFCQGICARVFSHETLVKFASVASVPVINALSDHYHPCQTVADVQTIRQVKGDLSKLKLAWIGDGNNVCNSLLIGSALSGMDMTVACSRKYSPMDEALRIAKDRSKQTGSKLAVTSDPLEAVSGADVVVTDTFISMGDEAEEKERLETFLPKYQVNESLMSKANKGAIFMHCLPAHRGEEVTAKVIDGPRSVVWQEAENRLHSQKAILYTLLKKYAI
ncbi:MAG: ornithine carbamoyltransferase [Nitrososphaerales archaeon]